MGQQGERFSRGGWDGCSAFAESAQGSNQERMGTSCRHRVYHTGLGSREDVVHVIV